MSQTLFAAISDVRGQLEPLGQASQSHAEQIADLSAKIDALGTKVDALTLALQQSVMGLTQTLLNVQQVIGSPEDQG
jgi:hypothetical protein